MAVLIGMLFGAGVSLLISSIKSPRLPSFEFHKPKKIRVNWPSYIDDVASGVRAGLPAPDAMWQASARLPIAPALWFSHARSVWQVSGFLPALNELEHACDDMELHQLIAVMRMVHETGSQSLASTLTQLARMVRQRQSLINEVQGRQAVTINAARVAVAAPWIVLVLTASRPQTRLAFLSSTGLEVLAGVLVVTTVSYVAMNRLGAIKQLGHLS